MKKFKVFLSIVLCAVLLCGGAIPAVKNAQASGTELALKVTESDATVTIERQDSLGQTLYTTMTKENLPQNAVIKLSLAEDAEASYKIQKIKVDGQEYPYASIPAELEVGNGSLVIVVYEETTNANETFNAVFYDYDYSSETGAGINNASNYSAESTSAQRLMMGVTDKYHDGTAKEQDGYSYGSDLGECNYTVPMILQRPGETTTVTGHANWNNGVYDGTNTGIDGIYWPIVTGLVTGLDASGNPVWGMNANGEQLYDPGFFTSEVKQGKHIYSADTGSEATLNFERNGYHYVLKSATVDGVTTTAGKNQPRFFPLDAKAGAEQKFVDPWHSSAAEDYEAHNWYFGIRHEFMFTVNEYDGPLEYIFEGDDDLWVFLDGELILDLGGIHSAYPGAYEDTAVAANAGATAWPNKVDLKPILSQNEGWRDREHKITILYMERGGCDSNCYMEFTLPIKAAASVNASIDIPAAADIVGQDTAAADGNFDPATDTVTVYLIDKSTINDANPTIIATKTTSAAVGWKVDFADVSLDEGIEYTVIGGEIQDFDGPVVTGNVSDGFSLQYTYNPETIDLNVQKVWDPSVIAAGKDTDSVEVALLADGVQQGSAIVLNDANNWETTIADLQVRKNKVAIVYTVEEINVPADCIVSVTGDMSAGYVITNNKMNNVTYSFVSGTQGMALPTEITALTPASTQALGSEIVTAQMPAQTELPLATGTWVFAGYSQGSLVVDGDINFEGTWVFQPKPEYPVTHVFVSGTSGKEIPYEVKQLLPAEFEVMEGLSASAIAPAATRVEVREGYWDFAGYDKQSAVVTDAVEFTGTWNYTEKAVYNVTHQFVSGTSGMTLPAEITDMTPTQTTIVEGNTAKVVMPAVGRVETAEGYWDFVGYDKDAEVAQQDVTFTGTWNYTVKPEYDVVHKFVSGSSGKELPDYIAATTPGVYQVKENETVSPTKPAQTLYEETEGFWSLTGYDKSSVVATQDVEFVGTWNYIPKNVYNVTYEFVSGTTGKTLPTEVLSLLPYDSVAHEGNTVTPAKVANTTVAVEDGTWTFESYDKESAVMQGDVKFTGTWTYTATPIYSVNHSFVSGTAGKELPAYITATTPASTTAKQGETVTSVKPAQILYEEADGFWSLVGYDKTSQVVNGDVEFVGTWNYIPKNVYDVTHGFVSGTSGKELPVEVLNLIPYDTVVHEGDTVVPTAITQTKVVVAEGIWSFVSYDKTSEVANADVHFTGTWTYADKQEFDVTYKFVSGTPNAELPNGVLDYLPDATTALEYDTVGAVMPDVKTVETPEGFWEFKGYDKTDVVVTSDVEFEGTWEYTAKATHTVAYRFESATADKSIPDEVIALLPVSKTVYDGDIVDAAQPSTTTVEVTDGIWTFVKYDKDSAVADADVVFQGTWEFTAVPTYKMSYAFTSGTPGKKLPTAVYYALPNIVENLKNGTVVVPSQPKQTSVQADDGTWSFVGWNRQSQTINNGDVGFVGTWRFTAKSTSNSNNSNSNKTPIVNNTTPVAPKTADNTFAGAGAAATLLMFAGVLMLRNRRKQQL